jgi:hypothetical protein
MVPGLLSILIQRISACWPISSSAWLRVEARYFSFLSDDDVLFPGFSKVQLPDLKLFPGSRSGAE